MPTPRPEPVHVHELLREHWGLEGALQRLPGENENYLVEGRDGDRAVLKIADASLTPEQLEFEQRMVEALHAAGLGLELPRVLPARHGGAVRLETGEVSRPARLLAFVPGLPWGETAAATPALLQRLGRLLARIAEALQALDHPAARRSHRWDLAAADQHRSRVGLVEGRDRRRHVEQAFQLYVACARPELSALPRGPIHGDTNDENLLVDGELLCGLVDFGDALEAPLVCELAIALAYVLQHGSDPLVEGAVVVGAYHGHRALTPAELRVLFPLVVARLAVTLTVCAERRREDAEHPTWFATEERAERLLAELLAHEPAAVGSAWAAETGLEPFPQEGANVQELLDRRRARIGPSLSISYRDPLKMVRGQGQFLHDDRGRPFLDLVNNVCHVGHCHPRVVDALQGQVARLNTNTRYLHDGLVDYADRLCATLPGGLDVCFVLNSGSEANELALRLARTHTGRQDVVVVDGAYHGHTGGLIAISPYKFRGPGGSGRPEPWVHVVPIADGYRGVHKGHGPAAGRAYGDEVGAVIQAAGAPIAGMICESLLSCGGQVIPPEGYLARAYEHVRAAGGLCIADEVQVGFGRVGSHFWAFETQGVVPDIVVMGKPIGNGHPLAAVVTTREIAESFANGMEFFATYGGNPVSCAVGLAVLDVIEEEGLQDHALELGAHFKAGLEELATRHALIGEVRGLGLFLGLELVRDRGTLEPADREADELVQRMRARGVLLSTDGPLHNVLKVKPPMVLERGDVDMVLRALDDELAALG